VERTFKTVGHSFYKNMLKLRFTNDRNRQGVLERYGHKDVHLVDLPQEMTKEDAARWLLNQNLFTPEVRALAQDMLTKRTAVDEVVEEPGKTDEDSRAGRGRPRGSKNRPKQAQAA
jgi:catechol-2,3-dioxygenase